MRLIHAVLAAALLTGVASTVTAAPPPRPAGRADTARNRAVVTAFFDLFYVQKKVRAAFETYVAPGYIQHNPVTADGRDAAIAALEPMLARNPAVHYEIKRIIVDGDLAAVHSLGHFAAGDRGNAIVDLVRLEDGKIVEHWDVIQPVPEKSANPHPMF